MPSKGLIIEHLNLLDCFLILFVILLGLSFYFTFFHPIQFSHLILREDTKRLADIELLMPADANSVNIGEERQSVYGELEWKVLEIGKTMKGDDRVMKIKAAISEDHFGVLRYGKYILSKGNYVGFVNNFCVFSGKVLNVRLQEEPIPT